MAGQMHTNLKNLVLSEQNQVLPFNRFEIIAKRRIIARLSYNSSFELYEKVDFLNIF